MTETLEPVAALGSDARREELWTLEWLEAETRRRGETAEEQLLAIFDVFDGWFRQGDFEGGSVANVLLEMRNGHPAGTASIEFLASIRSLIARFAEEADLREPEAFAHSWQILMKGAIVAAGEGDVESAQRAKRMGRLLIEQYR